MPAKYLKIANKLQEDIFQGLYNETGFLPTELEIAASAGLHSASDDDGLRNVLLGIRPRRLADKSQQGACRTSNPARHAPQRPQKTEAQIRRKVGRFAASSLKMNFNIKY